MCEIRRTMNALADRRAAARLLRIACVPGLCVAASAQGTISTERPGLLVSPALIPEHAVQIETGLGNAVFVRGNGVHSSAYSFPTLVRYGVSRDVEVRLFS